MGKVKGKAIEPELVFTQAERPEDVKRIYEYNIDAFSDSTGFNWNLEEIKKEVADGWELYGALYKDEIVAALFLKRENGTLYSKQTAIKMNHQGSGFSHQVKEFIERKAQDLKVKKVVNYCSIDNFRMYSLNESHGYKKTGRKVGSGQIVEWIKELK